MCYWAAQQPIPGRRSRRSERRLRSTVPLGSGGTPAEMRPERRRWRVARRRRRCCHPG
jgi:hypothetical protein